MKFRFQPGNKFGKGNGGRAKQAEIDFLTQLWDGKIKAPKVTANGLNPSLCKEQGVLPVTFKSGKDALAWHVLNGDFRAIAKLIDKLYADKREVDLGNKNGEALRVVIEDYVSGPNKTAT